MKSQHFLDFTRWDNERCYSSLLAKFTEEILEWESIPNLKQPEGSFLCGAYSIVACIRLYDDNKQVIKINKFNEATCDFSGDLVEIDTSADNDTLAEQIYKVTGIYSPFSMDGFVEEGGFNPLFCVAYVLQQFGFDVELLIKAPLDLEHLANEYPIEAQVLKKLNCPITYFEDSAEATKQRFNPYYCLPARRRDD